MQNQRPKKHFFGSLKSLPFVESQIFKKICGVWRKGNILKRCTFVCIHNSYSLVTFRYVLLKDHATKMESHKVKQQELIEQLKQQLEDLELYAYETGEAGLPQTVIVERQKIIIG